MEGSKGQNSNNEDKFHESNEKMETQRTIEIIPIE